MYGFRKVCYVTLMRYQSRLCFSRKKLGFTGEKVKHADEDGVIVNSDESIRTSLIRARRTIVDICLNNDFDYFGTFTFADDKVDVYTEEGRIAAVDKFLKTLANFKQLYAPELQYIVVPEFGEKFGRLHLHFIMSGIPKGFIRRNEHYKLDWKYFSQRFGFVQIAKIKDSKQDRQRVAFYCSKYITKDNIQIRSHRYFMTLGLFRPTKFCIQDYNASYEILEYLKDMEVEHYYKDSEKDCHCFSLDITIFRDLMRLIGCVVKIINGRTVVPYYPFNDYSFDPFHKLYHGNVMTVDDYFNRCCV